MQYGSVCSGIEAASVAWEPLGWGPAWFSEVEAFPSAVLRHHWPEVPNLGDMTKLSRRVLIGEVAAPDVLVGGTPCQAFSVAGMREGMADERGQLTMKYVELADAIDAVRLRARKPECITVWENVPGVLSDKQNAFGCFLGALAGEDRELQPAGKRWTNAGCVYGPTRAIAWRVLDAQYFGVAQRRRRVFVVASARPGFDPAAVLFERESVRRDSPPSREKGEGFAADVAPGVDLRNGRITGEVAHTVQAGHHAPDPGGTPHAIGYRHVEFGQYAQDGLASPLLARGHKGATDLAVCAVTGDIAHTLNTANNGKGCSEDGTGRGVPTIAFSAKDYGGDAMSDCSPTLRAGGHSASHANAGVMPAVAYNVHENQRAELTLSDTSGAVKCAGGKPGQGYPAVMTVHGTQDPISSEHHAHTLGRNNGGENAVFNGLAVRRLTPVECERLQGVPDGHTDVSYRNKPAADGPRYKAIGNSMAVPVMQWIGRRIQGELCSE